MPEYRTPLWNTGKKPILRNIFTGQGKISRKGLLILRTTSFFQVTTKMQVIIIRQSAQWNDILAVLQPGCKIQNTRKYTAMALQNNTRQPATVYLHWKYVTNLDLFHFHYISFFDLVHQSTKYVPICYFHTGINITGYKYYSITNITRIHKKTVHWFAEKNIKLVFL